MRRPPFDPRTGDPLFVPPDDPRVPSPWYANDLDEDRSCAVISVGCLIVTAILVAVTILIIVSDLADVVGG